MNVGEQPGKSVLMLLPSLRISGGVKEAIRLAEDLKNQAVAIQIVAMWRSKHELPCANIPVIYLSNLVARRSVAALQYPFLLLRFIVLLRRLYSSSERKKMVLLLTHFSTFALGWTSPRLNRYCFNQDVEWMFVKEGWRRSWLRAFILATSRRSRVITTNEFVENLYAQEGIRAVGCLSIWAPMAWLTTGPASPRDIEVVMLLRRGSMKRLDLYFELLLQSNLASLVITPDTEIFAKLADHGIKSVLRPSDAEIRAIYQRSKVFLLLSDTEGFGLPPLEAMGSGCVPLCRDSGGPRCYMVGPLASNLLPLQASTAEIFAKLRSLLSDPERLSALSEYAKRSFSAGFEVSLMRRNNCIITLSRTFRDEN